MEVESRWFSRDVQLRSESGSATVRIRGGMVAGQGEGRVRRLLRVPAEFAAFQAGNEHLSGDDVPHDVWTKVLVRDREVLGTVSQSHARLAFAIGTEILAGIARGELRGVRVDVRRWRRRGEQRWEEWEIGLGGIEVETAGRGPADGGFHHGEAEYRRSDGEGDGLGAAALRRRMRLISREQAGRLDAVVAALRHDDPDAVPHRWLLSLAEPASAASEAWQSFLVSEDAVATAVLQDILIGLRAFTP